MEDFKNTKYFQFLYNNHQRVFDDGDRFNLEMHQLISRNTDELAIVLKCHLILENYIDKFLQAGYPTIKWDFVNLTFSKKLELINTRGTYLAAVLYKAIKKLNSIRNKFAHDFTYEFKNNDLTEIHQAMDLWEKAKGKPAGTGIQLIEEFTIWACAMINIMTSGIIDQTPETGLAGYLVWLREMMQPLNP